ncbi:hypothetical protein FISHEDRAFT_8527, partial [Fistulina hepatica ATCC 64428]
PIVLETDGHGSHETSLLVELAVANNVILYMLPPHTTHRLQPCDVEAFGPLKREWQYQCDKVYEETHEVLKSRDVVQQYLIARRHVFKPGTIKQAWNKSGIDVMGTHPRTNPSIFTAADFAPSISSSTQLHLPSSFP